MPKLEASGENSGSLPAHYRCKLSVLITNKFDFYAVDGLYFNFRSRSVLVTVFVIGTPCTATLLFIDPPPESLPRLLGEPISMRVFSRFINASCYVKEIVLASYGRRVLGGCDC